MFVKKIVFIMSMIIILFSCSMDDTENQAIIQFKYETVYSGIQQGQPIYPVRFFDTNPAIPDRPEHFAYYKTKPGQYYLEYVLSDNRAYYMIYTIEIWKTTGKSTDGDGNARTWVDGKLIVEKDNYKEFTIDLSFDTEGPHWSDQYYAYDLQIEPIRGEIPSRSAIPTARNVGPLLYRITQKKENASMTIYFGVLNE